MVERRGQPTSPLVSNATPQEAPVFVMAISVPDHRVQHHIPGKRYTVFFGCSTLPEDLFKRGPDILERMIGLAEPHGPVIAVHGRSKDLIAVYEFRVASDEGFRDRPTLALKLRELNPGVRYT